MGMNPEPLPHGFIQTEREKQVLELDRLRAVNAKLVEALEQIANMDNYDLGGDWKWQGQRVWTASLGWSSGPDPNNLPPPFKIAREAIEAARK